MRTWTCEKCGSDITFEEHILNLDFCHDCMDKAIKNLIETNKRKEKEKTMSENQNITITKQPDQFGEVVSIRSDNKKIHMNCSMDMVRDMKECWGVDVPKLATRALNIIEKRGGTSGEYALAMMTSDECVSFKIAPRVDGPIIGA